MPPLPSVAQVRQLTAVTSRVVPPEFLDENDHVNIGRYFELGSKSTWQHFVARGLGEEYIAERGLSTFTAEHHLTYLSELRLGDRLSVHLRLLERSDKVVHALAFVVEDSHDRLSCLFESVTVHVDMTARRPVAFPADIAAAFDADIADHHRDWPAPVCGVMGVRRR